MSVYKDLDLCVQEYCKHLQKDYDKTSTRFVEFSYDVGRKYIHVIINHVGDFGGGRSSHSWIMINDDDKFKMGDILKSASWKAPARNKSRGNVLCGGYKHIKWAGV
jgi:hypothetical protein